MRPIVALRSLATARLVTCSSVENDAIWAMNSLSFMGFIGSWCWSWATKSLRNWSLPSEPLSTFFGRSSTLIGAVGFVEMLGISLTGVGSGEHVNQQPTGEL